MIIVTTHSRMEDALVKNTYQDVFPKVVQCYRCGYCAIPILLVDDNEGLVRQQRPNNVKIWPHDSLSFVNYLCTECGEMSVKWNQA